MGMFDKRDPSEIAAEVKSALVTLQETLDEGTRRNARDFLDKVEDLNTKLIAERKRADRMEEALRTGAKLDKYGEPSWPLTGYGRDDADYTAFFKCLRCSHGEREQAEQELKSLRAKSLQFKTLRTDAASQGGYLIPQIMDDVIKKNIIEISPVRAHARVRILPGKTMDVPRRLSVPLAQYEGETETAPTDQSIYGSEQVTAYRQTVTVPATLDMMVSSAFDLEAEIAIDVGESFAQGEGLNFVKGNGRKSPQGFTSDTRVVGYTSGTSADFTYTDLAKMSGGVKRGYQPWWFFNRKTLAHIQTLTSSIGVPLWQPMSGGNPATILGYPYDSRMIDLDDVVTGSGAKPIAFADLFKGYEIFDLIGMSVARDDLTKANQAITQWIFRRYNTGRVILPEAISVMTLL
jgi:HK97 family phage major capsid protein